MVCKVKLPASRNYYKCKFDASDIIDITCRKDGTENKELKVRVKSYCNSNVIGYLEADSFSVAPLNRNLVRCCLYNGNGCYLVKDTYLNILPIWVAKHFPLDNWYERDVYATTSDGGETYTKDKDFLKFCLIYTCLSNQNKCLTFDGSDGRHYQNELCFDNDTLASRDLKSMDLDEEEKALMDLWYKILDEAKATANYNPAYTYGVYQITKELNTFDVDGKTKVYHYPDLNGDLITLRNRLKDYYKSHITEKMFTYELLK